jgi:hypothetical protein
MDSNFILIAYAGPASAIIQRVQYILQVEEAQVKE